MRGSLRSPRSCSRAPRPARASGRSTSAAAPARPRCCWQTRVGAAGSVLAVDISEPMLTFAQRRSAERGHDHVRFLNADAQSHGFEPEAQDLLLSRFGVMFFSDPVAAFANLLRALRPGGRLAFVCWAPLEDNPWFKEPLAVGVAPARPARAAAAAGAGPAGARRDRLHRRDPERRGLRRTPHRDRDDPSVGRRDRGGGGSLRL